MFRLFFALLLCSLAPIFGATPTSMYSVVFNPLEILLDREQNLLLAHKEGRIIFRWSPASRAEFGPLPLENEPHSLAYSSSDHHLYIAYPNGRVTRLSLSNGAEEFFAQVELPVVAIQTAGEFLFVADASEYSVYSPVGQKISSAAATAGATAFAWSSALRRMFFSLHHPNPSGPDYSLAYVSIGAAGQLGAGTSRSFEGAAPNGAIRISPDGTQLSFGSVYVHDARSLDATYSFVPINTTDIAWRNQFPFQLQNNFGAGTRIYFPSSPDFPESFRTPYFWEFGLRVFQIGQTTVMVSLIYDQPKFRLFDAGLQVLHETQVNTPPMHIYFSGPDSLPENTPVGTVVGIFTDLDPEGHAHRYELFDAGPEYDDSHYFRIEGNQLILAEPLDFERSNRLQLARRIVDEFGLSYQHLWSIGVSDVNEPPHAFGMSNRRIQDQPPVGALVTSISVFDQDANQTHTVELLDDAAGRFLLSGRELRVARSFSISEGPQPTIRLRATDHGGLVYEGNLTITVFRIGEVTLNFSPDSIRLFVGNGILETKDFRISTGFNTLLSHPANDGALRWTGAENIAFTNIYGQPFRLLSIDVAEPAPGQNADFQIVPTLGLTRLSTNSTTLDGINDGPGPLRDFQTLYPGIAQTPLSGLLLLRGASNIIDNVRLFIGEPQIPFVWIRSEKPHAFERSPLGENDQSRHATFTLARLGFTNGPLDVQFSISGASSDDFAPINQIARFAPGVTEITFELNPTDDALSEGAEALVVQIAKSDLYTASQSDSVSLWIHDETSAAWLANHYPAEAPGAFTALDWRPFPELPVAGALFAAGTAPATRTSSRPAATFAVDGASIRAAFEYSRNPLADGWNYTFEISRDLESWSPGPNPISSVDLGNGRFRVEFLLSDDAKFIRMNATL